MQGGIGKRLGTQEHIVYRQAPLWDAGTRCRRHQESHLELRRRVRVFLFPFHISRSLRYTWQTEIGYREREVTARIIARGGQVRHFKRPIQGAGPVPHAYAHTHANLYAHIYDLQTNDAFGRRTLRDATSRTRIFSKRVDYQFTPYPATPSGERTEGKFEAGRVDEPIDEATECAECDFDAAGCVGRWEKRRDKLICPFACLDRDAFVICT